MAEPTLRPRRSGCSPSTGKLQLNSRGPFSIPSEPSHVQSPPLPSPSTAWATHTSNRDPWRGGRGADIRRERAMRPGEPRGLNPGAWWSPLESLTPLTPSPSPVAISNQPTAQRGRPVGSSLAMSCGGTRPNGSPLWGICHRRGCWFVVSVFSFSRVPRDSDIRSATHSTLGLPGSCCSCLSTLSFLSDK